MNQRERIKAKTSGRCTYCGTVLGQKWHIDHVQPAWRGRAEHTPPDTEANLVPACVRCNRWKKTLTPDEFRAEIAAQIQRLERDAPGFRLARDFGLLTSNQNKVSFHAEVLLTEALTNTST